MKLTVTEEEKNLVENFRQCDEPDRRRLIRYAETGALVAERNRQPLCSE